MQTTEQARPPLHPLIAVACGAVILVSAFATAALFGWLPSGSARYAEPTPAASGGLSPVPRSEPAAIAERNIQAPAQHRSAARRPAAERRTEVAEYAADKRPPVYEAAERPLERRAQSESAPVAQAKRCEDCGVVESVMQVQKKAEGSGLGAVGGAVVGGVLGNQIGRGSGRGIMTVVGAVGGGLAGNEIEKNMRTAPAYEVAVRMNDGTRRVITEPAQPGWRSGDKVRVVGDRIEALAP